MIDEYRTSMPANENEVSDENTSRLASEILNSVSHLVIATDPDGLVTFFNPASESALGYRSEDIVGHFSPALWHVESEVIEQAARLSEEHGQKLAPFDALVLNARLYGTHTDEWTLVSKEGRHFPAELTVTCMRNAAEEITGYLGVLKDITKFETRTSLARAQSEDAEAFLKLVIRNTPDLVFVKDKSFRIVQANDAFLARYPEEQRHEVIGYTTLEKYPENEAALFLVKDREAFETGQSEATERASFPDGSVRLLNTQKTRFENAAGEQFILGVSRDVTQRERLIEELQFANQELEEFVYRTSHDLRSPLVSSIALLGMISEALAEGDQEFVVQSVGHVTSSLEKLEHLVQAILGLAHTKNAHEDAQEVVFDQLIQDCLDKLCHLPNFDRLDIQTDVVVAKVMTVQKGRLTQIVENLISNAIKYQDPSEEEPYVRIGAFQNNNELVLCVEDNGLGIPEDQQSKLFGMFQRLHSRVAFGSGLGLYMVKKSARILGGDIVFTQPEKGAKFTLSVPIT